MDRTKRAAACGITGAAKPSEADLQITKRVAAAAQILQINFLNHVIVGRGFFSFQEAGLL
jgi:DNA repair protein RadC